MQATLFKDTLIVWEYQYTVLYQLVRRVDSICERRLGTDWIQSWLLLEWILNKTSMLCDGGVEHTLLHSTNTNFWFVWTSTGTNCTCQSWWGSIPQLTPATSVCGANPMGFDWKRTNATLGSVNSFVVIASNEVCHINNVIWDTISHTVVSSFSRLVPGRCAIFLVHQRICPSHTHTRGRPGPPEPRTCILVGKKLQKEGTRTHLHVEHKMHPLQNLCSVTMMWWMPVWFHQLRRHVYGFVSAS